MESVNPENPNQICVATISKVIEPLMWIHLDNSPFLGTSHIEHFESHNLFQYNKICIKKMESIRKYTDTQNTIPNNLKDLRKLVNVRD
jgi:hypothetical protein